MKESYPFSRLLLLPLLLLAFFSLQAQTPVFEFKVQYMDSDDLTWGVYTRPILRDQLSVDRMELGSAQVTLLLKNNGVDDIRNIKGIAGNWSLTAANKAPAEAPNFNYITIGLSGTRSLSLSNNEELLLFTFQAENCLDTLGLIDNNTDPFAVSNNSQNINAGIDFSAYSITTQEVYTWKSNYAPFAYSCQDCDEDGIVDALEDTNGDGVFSTGDASNLCNTTGAVLDSLNTPPTGGQNACITINSVERTSPSECGKADGTITIDAVHEFGNPLQYSIDGGRTWVNTSTIRNLEAGVIYRVELRDFLGLCFESYGQLELEHPDCNTDPCITNPFSINDVPNQTICMGSSVSLNISGGISYSWTPTTGLSAANIANPIANPTSTTTYTVVVTNADGCIATDDITVTVTPTPTASAGTDVTICSESSTTLNASGGTAYQWSPATGLNSATIANPIATPTSTTTYTVVVTNDNGCSTTDNITLTVASDPIANAGTDASICLGSSTTLNASGGTAYQWSPATGLNNTTIANPIANPTIATTYTVTVSNENGCTSTDQITISIGENTAASAGMDQSICVGSRAQLTATGGTVYQWSPAVSLNDANIATPLARPGVTTIYTVTISDASGCTSVDQVSVNIEAGLSVDAGEDQIICIDEPTSISVIGGDSYIWSPEEGLDDPTSANPKVLLNNSTTYCVTVTDIDGCTGTDCVFLELDTGCEFEDENEGEGTGSTVNPCENGPIVLACPDKFICPNGQAQLVVNGGIRWEWTPATGLDDPTSAIPIAAPNTTTTYTVTAWDINDCSATEEVVVTILSNSSCGQTPPPCQSDFIPEEKHCIDSITNIAEVCLPISESDMANKYTISLADGSSSIIHGCDFVQVIHYQYTLLPDFTNTYTIKSWKVDNTVFSGSFNSKQELEAFMQSNDPAGNWKLDEYDTSIFGGNPNSVYEGLILEATNALEIGLLPNYTFVPTGTLVEVDMTDQEREVLTIIEIATGCEDQILIERCE